MCGRYTVTRTPRELAERFNARLPPELFAPRYNAAPTQALPVVVNEGGRSLELQRWGLIPSWAKDPGIGSRLINARCDGVADKPSFRSAFKKRRCLVPADGFYEWAKHGAAKTPMRITLSGGELFAFAGLWEVWKDPGGGSVRSFTIVTTDANATLKPIHDRMPVILRREAEAVWLDEAATPADLLDIMQPYREDGVSAYAVSIRVNSPRNDDASLIEATRPVAPSPPPAEATVRTSRRRRRAVDDGEAQLF